MGQDFRCVFGHSLSVAELWRIPDQFNEIPTSLQPLFDKLNLGNVTHWTWDKKLHSESEFKNWFEKHLEENGVASLQLEGNGCIWFDFSYKIAELAAWIRWGEFCKSSETQQALQSVCIQLIKIIGGKELFYIPDSACLEAELAHNLIFENGDIEQFRQVLEQHGGPAKKDLQELSNGGYSIKKITF